MINWFTCPMIYSLVYLIIYNFSNLIIKFSLIYLFHLFLFFFCFACSFIFQSITKLLIYLFIHQLYFLFIYLFIYLCISLIYLFVYPLISLILSMPYISKTYEKHWMDVEKQRKQSEKWKGRTHTWLLECKGQKEIQEEKHKRKAIRASRECKGIWIFELRDLQWRNKNDMDVSENFWYSLLLTFFLQWEYFTYSQRDH